MARRIAEEVAAQGGRVYYVGGFVRDAVLGRVCKDVDIEVHGIEEHALAEILDRLGERLEMGKSFGIFALRHYSLDIAMPKTETGEAAPFMGVEQAARRRDLTMNALMQDVLTGEILDPFGGLAHIEQKSIHPVSEKSFFHDPLRILRAARFAAQFGFAVSEQTLVWARAQDLSHIAPERVWGELEKALTKTARPSVFFRTLRQMQQLGTWFPEVQALIGVEQDPRYHPEGDVWEHTMLVLDRAAELRDRAREPFWSMLSALCHDFGKVAATQEIDGRIRALGHEEAGLPLAERFLGRLSRENKMRQYVCSMVELHMRPNLAWRQGSGDKTMCKLYDRSLCPEDLLLLCEADHLGRPNAFDYADTRRFLQEKLDLYHARMRRPFVMGEDLIREGLMPGPRFHEALAYAHKLRLAGIEKESALKQTLAYLRKNE